MTRKGNSLINKILGSLVILPVAFFMLTLTGCDQSASDQTREEQITDQSRAISDDFTSLAGLLSGLQSTDTEGGTTVDMADITAQYEDLLAQLSSFRTLIQGISGISEGGNISALIDILTDFSGLTGGELEGVGSMDDYIALLESLASAFNGVEDAAGLAGLLDTIPQLNLDLLTAILPVQLNDFAAMLIEGFNTLAQMLGLDSTIDYDSDTATIFFTNYDITEFFNLLDQLQNIPAGDSGARAAVDLTTISADDLAPVIGFIMGLLEGIDVEGPEVDATDPQAISDLILDTISGLNIMLGSDELVAFIDLLLPVLDQVNPQQADPDAGTELTINSELVYQIGGMMDAFADLTDTIWLFGINVNEAILNPLGLNTDLIRTIALQVDEIAKAIEQVEGVQ